jgi:hypothetical protein
VNKANTLRQTQPPQAQRASVTPSEIRRYEEYNERHGAKYVPVGEEGQAVMDEDEW